MSVCLGSLQGIKCIIYGRLHDNTHGWSVDREPFLGLSLKTGKDNNNYMDEACRRARQINDNITVKGRRVTNQTYLGF